MRRRVVALFALCCAPFIACSRPSSLNPHVKVVDTSPLLIDRLYHSMDGPHDRQSVDITGIDWITSYRTEVVDAGDGQRLGDEFFCHSQVQLNNLTRLLVTATGTTDIVFPKGFGLPLHQILGGIPEPAWRGVSVFGMVLNNFDTTMNRSTRVRMTMDYYTNAEAKVAGLKKLYKVELPMTVQPAAGEAPEMVHGAEACVLVGGLKSHWLVPPGPQVTTKRYQNIFPVDSTVHFVNAHLHNHGVSMRLVDVTDGDKVLWRTDVEYEKSRRQIARIPEYSSEQGFRVFKDHEYRIEAYYENITEGPIDAMASVYVYYHPLVDVNITYPHAPPPGSLLERPPT